MVRMRKKCADPECVLFTTIVGNLKVDISRGRNLMFIMETVGANVFARVRETMRASIFVVIFFKKIKLRRIP